MKIVTAIYLLLFTLPTLAQPVYTYDGSIGKFEGASAFDVNAMGRFYVADASTNEICIIDTMGVLIKTIGGYGWGESAFDNPCDVYATTLNVYVTDKNNNRVQFFDKDLNYISQLKYENNSANGTEFYYPTSAAVSPQGDMYLVDSDNSRILKYNLSGEFQQEIGSYDAGRFALDNPAKLAVSPDNKIYVTDGKEIVVFDQYGTGLTKFDPGFEPGNIHISGNVVLINNSDSLKFYIIGDKGNRLVSPGFLDKDLKMNISDALIYKNKLYVLTGREIKVFRRADKN